MVKNGQPFKSIAQYKYYSYKGKQFFTIAGANKCIGRLVNKSSPTTHICLSRQKNSPFTAKSSSTISIRISWDIRLLQHKLAYHDKQLSYDTNSPSTIKHPSFMTYSPFMAQIHSYRYNFAFHDINSPSMARIHL